MNEVWKPVKGYEGLYEVSNQGEVKSLRRGIILKPNRIKQGYLQVKLQCEGQKPKCYLVHRLVAQAFIPNPDNLPYINHKNEIKNCNHADNLEWCTNSYNMRYGEGYKQKILSQTAANRARASKPVAQLKDGVEIARHPSLTAAAQSVGVSLVAIFEAIHGRCHQSRGYQWKYIKGENA